MTAPREHALNLLERLIREAKGDDPRATAAIVLTALEGQGWRPTEARPAADWRHQAGGGRPDEAKPGGADYRAKLAEVRAKASRDARALGHDTSTGGTL